MLHLRQRTINFLAGTMPQRMYAGSRPESNGFS
jgi:hypothetical protein